MVKHPFDADGGILGITFSGNTTATTRFRYVRTIAFTNERRKGQRLYTGMDSTRELGFDLGQGLGNDLHTPMFRHHLLPGLNKKRKNLSNIRAIYWGKRLLSMWEGGQPYKMDGLALSTEGRSQLGGVLKEKDPFGSKMVIDPVKNRAIMYRLREDSKSSKVTLFEFNDKFRLVDEGEVDEEGKSSVDLPGLAILNDMAVTENYAVFVQPAVSTAMQFMFIKDPGPTVSVENAPAMLHLVPRVGSNKEPMSLTIPFDGAIDANLQFCNAYEDGNKIIIDAMRSDGLKKPSTSAATKEWPFVTSRADYEAKAANKSLWRYEVDLGSRSVSKTKLSDVQCYFGTVRPNQSTQKHDEIFMAIGGLGEETAPPQGIAKFDCNSGTMDSWLPEPHQFCGEPMFAPKADSASEDDGYLLTVLFDGKAEKSEVLIFESSAISEGPVCRIPIGIGVPHGLHGCFTASEEATWSFEEIQRRSKLADKIEAQGDRWNEVKSDFSGLGLRFDDMEEYFGDSFLS
jgi:all-trans-8'-apo-beta-carotenal 15,15'-oxygenase